ncbi:Tetratricopeptide repeat-containing protein [Salinimicrobium catena]|uniref:Tetratricopeptide repeat-containing protein n=1 Tax=Salinimicrobium catena TaxID=390640 RepID=A0A1H5M7J4_9FLAO|nr:tetratricopeptide repeat protein [Salinimicrobium catena]SDL18989.1 Tetratricopeptide repeat-containing protein [Salinimicrobium catena]SEE84701.1 Tetratricopeptide repeat-containing protein [Salinimicrobium catena]
MKTRILTAALAMFTVVAFGQKKEIRRAGKAVEKGEYKEAKNYLQQAEAQLTNADEDEKADFYLYKGYALIGTGENVPTADLMAAADAFQKAAELGHDDAQQGMMAASNALVNGAIADQNAQKFSEAADKLFTGYQLNKQDTVYLYYAASNAVNAKDYGKALEYYEELRDLGFTGEETVYTAVNKETGEVERMANKEQRDLFVKSGNYTNPKDEVSESKKGEIAKNIALIYIEKGEDEKAIAAIENAKEENPGDVSLMQAEADMYYRMDNMAKYREIMEKIVEQNPDDAVLYYNLGVSAAQMGENDRAMDYYKRAIELDPSMHNARINLAYVILAKERPIVDEMNSLGMSKADQKKYDQLAEQRNQLYRDALPHLEKVLEKDPNNVEAARTMMNMYYQLNETAKAEEMKQKVAEIEAQQ